MPFSKDTAIICIGHLPEHINRKIELLSEAGYTKALPVITRDTTPDAIKSLLKEHADDGLFLVGGAMRGTYVELMADLDSFIASEIPQLRVHNVTKVDFPPDATFPPSSEVVAQAAVTTADRYLAEAQSKA